ncbi:serine/threonine protein kinase [Piscinibacter sp.]|jgi:serine/threonine protein kinase|uniref:serine/threonine protein kinase n=1 Tax=Piscinibacter sp. TaxID=1903157 RepID=UPI001B7314F8|nr:serine/threonine protein kinase [Piscinibacter sp.]MBK7533242.1 protein kinase [Piscinibacter sp.]MBP6542155.1 protein kinase [Piscinibacter sp.]HOY33605.1 protein kinase [Piscinibacter sp.]HPG78923.1 protein kinase [Piscinibacter sp.]
MSADPPAKAPAAPRTDKLAEALPPGTRFGEFEILGVLGIGGFGVVYLAQDHSLERQVALKEYMPSSLAVRGDGPQITLRTSAYADTYAAGLRSFVNEARLLARFDHPSLLKVYRFWEDNGTAYMVMPYLQGATLRDTRRAMTGPPDEAWLRGVLGAVLDALEHLHQEGVFHRDIAPDNILLTREGAPILLDFGAARRVISNHTQAFTAILKPSYAPIEQYAEMSSMRQGPWTDLYALGAVMHFLLTGKPPMPSTARAVQPGADMLDLHESAEVSPRFVQIVGWMLSVRPQDRPQSVAELRAVLDGQRAVPAVHHDGVQEAGSSAAAGEATQILDPTVPDGGRYAEPTRLDTAHQPTQLTPRPQRPAPPGKGPPMKATPPGSPPPLYVPQKAVAAAATPSPAVAAETASSATARRLGPWIAGAVGLSVAAAAAAWVWSQRTVEPPALPPPVVKAPAAAPVPGYAGPALGQVASVPTWGQGTSAPAR